MGRNEAILLLAAIVLCSGIAGAQSGVGADPESRLHELSVHFADLAENEEDFREVAFAELERYSRLYPEGRFRDDVYFRMGRIHAQNGSPELAAARFFQVAVMAPNSLRASAAAEELAKVLRDRGLKSQRDRYAAAAERFGSPVGADSVDLRRAFIRSLLLIDDYRAASILTSELSAYMDLYPTAGDLPELYFAAGGFDERRGANREAVVAFERIGYQWPESPFSTRGRMASAAILGFKLKRPLDAIARYRSIAVDLPNSADAATAWLRMGDVERRILKRPEIAIRDYDEVLQRYPEHPDALAALLAKAEVLLEDRHDFEGAMATYADGATRFAEHARAPELLERAAEIAEKRLRDRARAAEYLEHVASRYPRFEGAAPDLYHAAELREDEGEFAYAQSLFSQVASRFPDHALAKKAGRRAASIAEKLTDSR